MDIQSHAVGLVGVLVPVLTQLVKLNLLKWNGKAAQLLSFLVAAVAVAGAQLAGHQALSIAGIVPDLGIAWTLSQLVYHQVPAGLAKLVVPGKG